MKTTVKSTEYNGFNRKSQAEIESTMSEDVAQLGSLNYQLSNLIGQLSNAKSEEVVVNIKAEIVKVRAEIAVWQGIVDGYYLED